MGAPISDALRIAFVGFGEAAQAFVSGWAPGDPGHITAFDIKTDNASLRDEMAARYRAHGVSGQDTLGEALADADAVFSVVTADQALVAAVAASAAGLREGALWLDCNSCAPQTKQQAAGAIETAGGRYVDVAIMAPVHPRRHLVPLLVSGPHADAAIAALETLGMQPQHGGDRVGDASSVKMIRSVMVKGMEALSAECFLAARRAGVEEQVLASLSASDPDIDWRARGSYNLERMMVHGARRAAEMREVALTVAGLGLPAGMSEATATWQDHVARATPPAGEDDLASRADAILERL